MRFHHIFGVILFSLLKDVSSQNYSRTECITYFQQQGLLPGFSGTTNAIVTTSLTATVTATGTATTNVAIETTTTSQIISPTSVEVSTEQVSPVTSSSLNQVNSASTSTMSEHTISISITTSSSSVISDELSSSVQSSIVESSSSIATITSTMTLASNNSSTNSIVYSMGVSTTTTSSTQISSSSSSMEESSTVTINPSTSQITAPTSSISTTTGPSQTQICKQILFGNASISPPFPHDLLPEYGATTTLPPTTTAEPNTTLPTTPTAEQARERLCNSMYNWTFEVENCKNPCYSCVHDYLNFTDEYYICKEWNNNTDPVKLFQDEPMLLTLYMNKFGTQLSEFDDPNYCKYAPRYREYKNFLWSNGKKYRYSDLILPDYNEKMFLGQRWHRRNDTIEVPYGVIPRGVYTYEFIMYDHIIDKHIATEKTRYKHEWSYKHPIVTGAFIDTRVERGLYTNERLVINSAIISLELSPPRKNPLPGEVVISFTHLDRSLTNPVCVYWQPLSPDQKDVMPIQGYWSNYGVRVYKTNISMTVCRSTHLSSFALLMEPPLPAPEEKIDPFDALNIFFTLITIIVLCLYLLAMIMLKCYQSTYSRIYMLLAFCALFAQILYLAGMSVRSRFSVCTTVSVWMEFFHVAVMMWMTLESVHQLSRIRYFFNENTNIDAFYNILGFGFPIAVLVALQDFPYTEYDGLRFCWLYIQDGDVVFFAGPMVVLTVVTIFIRVITYFDLKRKWHLIETDINYQRAYNSLQAAAAILPTYMLFWIIATLSVQGGDALENTGMLAVPLLQILFAGEVFYFYFYRNDEVKDAIKQEMGIREKQKLRTYRHLRGLHMKVSYEAYDNEEYDNDSIADIKKFNNKDVSSTV